MCWKVIKEQPLIHQAINGVSGANYFPRSVLFIKRIAKSFGVNGYGAYFIVSA
jgi:hypothetical protein